MINFLKFKRFLIYFLLASVGALFFAIGFFINDNSNSQKIARAATQELRGFAWAARPVPFGTELGGPGWISFNCLDGNVCATSNYKVVYDESTGNMSGYAWSSNIGWIRFDESSGGYPEPPNYNARIDPGTGNVTGWARACAVFQSGCSGALRPDYERGGWDGWIKMAGTTSDGKSYGLKFDNTSGMFLQGTDANPYFAWGSDVVGWINFCVTPGTITCVGRVSGVFSPPPTTATTTPPGGRREIPPS